MSEEVLENFNNLTCIDTNLYLTISGDENAPSQLPPLFLGYYEETHFAAPHYQSIVPFQQYTPLKSNHSQKIC